jgi:hypothetical protein
VRPGFMIILLFLFSIEEEAKKRERTVISLSMLNKSLPLLAVFDAYFRRRHHHFTIL